MGDETIIEARQELAREANHEAVAIVSMLKEKFCDLNLSPEDMFIIRGMVHRLHTLNDVVFEALLNGQEVDERELAKMVGTLV